MPKVTTTKKHSNTSNVPREDQAMILFRLPRSVREDLSRAVARQGHKSDQAWFEKVARDAIRRH